MIASIFLIHVFMGVAMVSNPHFFDSPQAGHSGQPPPVWMGYLFAGIGGVVVLLGWTMGALTVFSGRCLRHRRRRLFSLVIAGMDCLQVPFGTVLGIFTIIVLLRPSMQALYQETPPA